MEKPGELIRKLRTQRGWSKSRLARESGISRVQIVRIESGETEEPNKSTFNLLVGAINRSDAKLNDFNDLQVVIDWFKRLSQVQRSAVLANLSVYERDVVNEAKKIVREVAARTESDPRTAPPARGRKSAG